jgi:hypothetical protein
MAKTIGRNGARGKYRVAFGSIAGRYVGRANAIFRHPVTQDIGAGNRRERPVRIESEKRQLLAADRLAV